MTGIDEIVATLDADLVTLRHDIHRRPELAGAEIRTAALVAERLRAAGAAVTTGVGGHGVVAVVEGAGDGPTIAYRADMDAVADNGRVAHLCGHDVHTAVGVGIAQVFARMRDRFDGRVLFLFQPAEETLQGARAMIEAGALEPVPPQEIYALHCGPLSVGEFAVMPGYGLPGLDTGHIDVPTVAEAERIADTIDGWFTVGFPQTAEEFAQIMADLQTPDGPLSRFVFGGSRLEKRADGTARVWFWLRAWPDDRFPELRERIAALAGPAEFRPEPFPGMVCSPELSLAAAGHLGRRYAVTTLHASFPFNGEDFALFLRRVPGAMFYLGVGGTGRPHAPDFAADDRAIGVGVRAMAGLLLNRLQSD